MLDETDGRAARTFNQSSTLGAVLDMVTDRQVPFSKHCLSACVSETYRRSCIAEAPEETAEVESGNDSSSRKRRLATAGLLAVLGMLYPRSYMAFLGLMFLDIFSHWSAESDMSLLEHTVMRRCCMVVQSSRLSLPVHTRMEQASEAAYCACAGFRCTPHLSRAAARTRWAQLLLCSNAVHAVNSPHAAPLCLLSHCSTVNPPSLPASAGREVAELAGTHVLQESHVHGRVLHLLRGPVPLGELPGHASVISHCQCAAHRHELA